MTSAELKNYKLEISSLQHLYVGFKWHP